MTIACPFSVAPLYRRESATLNPLPPDPLPRHIGPARSVPRPSGRSPLRAPSGAQTTLSRPLDARPLPGLPYPVMDDFHVTPIGQPRPERHAKASRPPETAPPPAQAEDHPPAALRARPEPPGAQLTPRGFERLSTEETQRRIRVNHANRAAGTGRDPMRVFEKRARPRDASRSLRATRRHLDANEVLDMTSTLARQFYARSQDTSIRDNERKHATTSFAVLVDKWTIVSGRPTAILAFAEPGERSGVLELARRLAASAGERA